MARYAAVNGERARFSLRPAISVVKAGLFVCLPLVSTPPVRPTAALHHPTAADIWPWLLVLIAWMLLPA